MAATINCPNCEFLNYVESRLCRSCGTVLSRESGAVQPIPISQIPIIVTGDKGIMEYTVADLLQVAVWLIAFVLFAVFLRSLSADLGRVETVFQQNAAAAINGAYVIIIYCIARAVSEILKTAKR